jgi:hypothetical protein
MGRKVRGENGAVRLIAVLDVAGNGGVGLMSGKGGTSSAMEDLCDRGRLSKRKYWMIIRRKGRLDV